MYGPGEYDLAGFCVGEVKKEDLLDGKAISAGDQLIGISSSGFHSNGYSLIRKLVDEGEDELKQQLLTPTRIYISLIKKLRDKLGKNLKGLSHITGGGWDNIQRMNKDREFEITFRPGYDELPEVFEIIGKRSQLSNEDLYKTFNMGVGLVVAVSPDVKKEELKDLIDYPFWDIGFVKS
jgi:phosphoribosylformylglycinamidine cyclo-ligase